MIDDQETDNQEILSTPPSVVQGPEVRGKVFYDGHIELRSQQPPTAVFSLGDNIHLRLATWLTTELAAIDVQLPGAIVFGPEDNVSPTPFSSECFP